MTAFYGYNNRKWWNSENIGASNYKFYHDALEVMKVYGEETSTKYYGSESYSSSGLYPH